MPKKKKKTGGSFFFLSRALWNFLCCFLGVGAAPLGFLKKGGAPRRGKKKTSTMGCREKTRWFAQPGGGGPRAPQKAGANASLEFPAPFKTGGGRQPRFFLGRNILAGGDIMFQWGASTPRKKRRCFCRTPKGWRFFFLPGGKPKKPTNFFPIFLCWGHGLGLFYGAENTRASPSACALKNGHFVWAGRVFRHFFGMGFLFSNRII